MAEDMPLSILTLHPNCPAVTPPVTSARLCSPTTQMKTILGCLLEGRRSSLVLYSGDERSQA